MSSPDVTAWIRAIEDALDGEGLPSRNGYLDKGHSALDSLVAHIEGQDGALDLPENMSAWERNEAYWRSWAATRVLGFTLFGMMLGVFTASVIWWAFTAGDTP